VNLTTLPVSFTAVNIGTSNLDIFNPLALSGPDSSQFTITGDLTPVNLIPGANTSFTVNFTPNTTGTKNAILTIMSTDPDVPNFILNLTGVSLVVPAPEIQITRSRIILVSNVTVTNYGTVHVGNNIVKTYIMYNIGSDDLHVTGISITGSNPSHYSTNFAPVPSTITPGSTKTFTITFSPHSKGWKYANINFVNDDSDESTFAVKVKGRGN
jgi:trimeric autotransporter adhesin